MSRARTILSDRRACFSLRLLSSYRIFMILVRISFAIETSCAAFDCFWICVVDCRCSLSTSFQNLRLTSVVVRAERFAELKTDRVV